MKENINSWQDLANKSVLLKINDKNFYGSFYIKNQKLFLNITMTNDIEEWRKTCNDIECISANLVETNRKITLLNCMYSGHSSTGWDPILNANVEFWVDRVLLDYDLKEYNDRFITSIKVEYADISWLTNKKVYNYEILKNEIFITPLYKEYRLDDKDIIFCTLASISQSSSSIKVGGTMSFTFAFKNKQNFEDGIQYIYFMRNLLMLFGKRNINIITQKFNEDSQTYKLLDCEIDNSIKLKSEESVKHLNHRNGFKIENLENFISIITKFEELYERLNPILELYYNVIKYKVPYLTRFVNDLTMLENCSREFDDTNALNLTIKKIGKSPKNGADFVDRVKSLINNINSVYNLSDIEIDMISTKIKSARTYYVHYDSNGLKFDENKLFKYVYFIEDVIILNIYLLLGIDINKIKYISYNNYYYDVKKLI